MEGSLLNEMNKLARMILTITIARRTDFLPAIKIGENYSEQRTSHLAEAIESLYEVKTSEVKFKLLCTFYPDVFESENFGSVIAPIWMFYVNNEKAVMLEIW